MPTEVHTISSGESDDGNHDMPPRVPAGPRDTLGSFMYCDPNSDNHSISPSLRSDIELSDNNLLLGCDSDNESPAANSQVQQNYRYLRAIVDLTWDDGNSSPESVWFNPRRANALNPIREGSPKPKKPKAPTAKEVRQQRLAKEKAAKTLLEEQKAAWKLDAERNKMNQPGECMKYMHMEGHPSLWERWYMTDVPREAAAAGVHVTQVHTLCNPALIVWTRTVPRVLDVKNGEVKLNSLREPCDRALYIAEVEELCEMVKAHTLTTHLSQISELCDCKLTLVVFKVNDYFKAKTSSRTEKARALITTLAQGGLKLGQSGKNMLVLGSDLLVSADCDTVTANTANELALTIVQITKAIAEAPYKKAKRAVDEQAAYYMKGDNKKCVAVNRDGVGVSKLWQQMLAILPQSGLETSRAICAQYKSPLALYECLQSSDGIDKLAGIGVSRTAVEGARARRVGPEFARKLHTLFTAQNGDQLVE